MPTATAWTVGALARKAGVTVRTLHHYDQRGLLSPSNYSPAGYRLYSERDLLQLQQILTLKALGLPLEVIQRILAEPGYELRHCLRQQRRSLQQRIKELHSAVEALELIERQLDSACSPEPDLIFKMMEVIQMKQSQDWMEQYYTPEQLEAFKARQAADPGEAERGTQAWMDLFAEIRAHIGQDPASAEVQALLPDWQQRWQGLIQGFTGGDAGVSKGLNQLYANIEQAPPQFRQWYEQWADVREFMDQAKQAQSA
ncbi:MAG: hypothetical protein CVV27_15410 [Candidatus Melainabacteria bacterium HGW-Melainabacteria-1]|nr:MAG: hypothetical protein CVV27_15410 [Candidatus Melainabacteria bacterium HGW-Melainabacteria-1]